MKITIEWTINRRSENPEQPKTVTESNSASMSKETCEAMLSVLTSPGSEKNVTIPYLMPKFLKVTSIGKATPVVKLMRNEDQSK